jgi:hypothetical protein
MTDSLLISEDFEMVKDLFDFSDKLGCYKFEENKSINIEKRIEQKQDDLKFVDFNVHHIKINNEYNNEEFKKAFDTVNCILVKGCAGSGKTSSLKKYAKYKNALFISPFNKLCQNLRKDGYEAITLNMLMGYGVNEQANTKMKAYDIEPYEIIFFDEVYLYDIQCLKAIDTFIKKNKDKQIYATGDIDQCKPFGCGTNNIKDLLEYRKQCVNIVFPNQITLDINKRLKTDEDRKIMKNMKLEIMNCNIDIVKTFKKYNIKMVHNWNEVKTLNNICYFNYRCDMVNKHIQRNVVKPKGVLINGIIYYKDMELLCKTHYRSKDVRLYVNYTYRLTNINEKTFSIRDDVEKNDFTLSIDKLYLLSLPYGNTVYSVQGMSVEGDMTIFDSNTPYVDRNIIWTAITRCCCLSNLQIFIHSGKEVERLNESKFKQYLNMKIKGYKEQDSLMNRKFNDREYIEVNDILSMLDKDKHVCGFCNKPYEIKNIDGVIKTNITVQRENNSKPHIKGNCSLLCCKCNCALSNKM